MHSHLVGQRLAGEVFAVHLYNLVAGYHACTLGRAIANDLLHAQCVLTDGELDAYTRERTAQVVVGNLHVVCGDIHAVRVKLSQNLRHSFLHQVVYVDRVHILVINDVQQVVQLIAAGIDDAQAVAREVVSIESAYQNAYDHAYSHDNRHESVFVVCHFAILLFRYFRYSVIPLFRHYITLRDKPPRCQLFPAGRCRLSGGISRRTPRA